MARDIGALQSSPGRDAGALQSTGDAGVSLSLGADAHFAPSESMAAAVSITLGGTGGMGVSRGAITLSLSLGGLAHFALSGYLKLPNSISLGGNSHFFAGITFPSSISLGGHSHFALSDSLAAHPAITLGARAGYVAVASTSVTQTQLVYAQMTANGSGYTSPPTVTITDAGGSHGITAVAVLGTGAFAGEVVGINVTNSGNGTAFGPLAVAIAGGGGSGAAGAATLASMQSQQAAQQQYPFQVRAEGYGALTIESLITPTQQAAQTQPQLIPPPLPQPSQDRNNADYNSRPWNSWFQQVYLALSGGTSVLPGFIQVVAPSVDETDSEWYATGTMDGHTDPASFTATFFNQSRFGIEVEVTAGGTGYSSSTLVTITGANGSGFGATAAAAIQAGAIVAITVSANGYGYIPPLSVEITDSGGGSGAAASASLGRQFGIGDFILWNDPTISAGRRLYEIDQITKIVPIDATHATFTLARRANQAASDVAQYGSPFGQHTSCAFYRLINKLFQSPATGAPGPQIVKFLWDNMTVVAVTVALPGETPITVNLGPQVYTPGAFTLAPGVQPPTPGLRTMNGAAYTSLGIPGSLGASQTSVQRISVQAHESIRTVYAKVFTAPLGATAFNGDANAAIVIYVCYISPGGVVGLIDTLVIDTGQNNSYSASNVPDGRQMPYHALWPFAAPNTDWPPNRLPQCAGALSGAGALQLPITPSGASTVLFAPDGQIDFIVAQVGTVTAGANLVVTVQT